MKKLNVGILGPGTVGGGAYEILTKIRMSSKKGPASQ